MSEKLNEKTMERESQSQNLAPLVKEEKQTIAPIISTKEIDIAESMIEMAAQAEQLIEAMQKIKLACLRLTTHSDWVLIDGVPWLATSGAEKIARMFGISWKIQQLEKQDQGDYYVYYCVLDVYTRNRKIEAIGTARSDDPFFSIRYNSNGEKMKLEKRNVDENNIRKKAYTNALHNGICRFLGIRTITLEDLQAANLNVQKIKSYSPKIRKEEEEKKRKSIQELKQELKDLCLSYTGGDIETAKSLIEEVSSFVSQEGKKIQGKVLWDVENNEKNRKWIGYAIGKMKKLLEEKKAKENENSNLLQMDLEKNEEVENG